MTRPAISGLFSLRSVAVAFFGLGAAIWSGCAEVDMAAKIPLDAVARLSPAPEVVSPQVALDSAMRYVREHPGADFAVGSGDSMLPLYQDRAVIVLTRPAMSALQVGQTVVFMNSGGIPTAHILVRRAPAGWVTMGLNNQKPDSEYLSESSYAGVVVKAYQPTSSVILAYSRAASDGTFAVR